MSVLTTNVFSNVRRSGLGTDFRNSTFLSALKKLLSRDLPSWNSAAPAIFFLLYTTQDSPLSIMYDYLDAGVFCLIAVSCEIYVRLFEAITLISMGGLP